MLWRLNRKFVELKSWYLFDSRFCNVAKGNEKGHVENLVKRAQRTFLTPLPEVTDLAVLNRKLKADCDGELRRTTKEGATHRELWQEEQQYLLPLPADRFPACTERASRPFRDDPFGPEFSLLRRELEYRYEEDGTRQYIDVLLLLAEHPEEAVIEAVRSCVERRVFSRDAVLHTLSGKPRPTKSHRLDLAHRPDLAHWGDGIRASAVYDQLRQLEEVAV